MSEIDHLENIKNGVIVMSEHWHKELDKNKVLTARIKELEAKAIKDNDIISDYGVELIERKKKNHRA